LLALLGAADMTGRLLTALLAELHDDPAALGELRTLLGAGPSIYTPQTLAAELGVTPRAVRAAIERSDLQARRSGRGYVIAAEAVGAWASSPARRRRRTPARVGRPLRDAVDGLG
jgi:excisionase family DNA binding protein